MGEEKTVKENNMFLWDNVKETDPKYTKTVNQRGGFTSINAQYQLLRATEAFGPYGKGWGIQSIDYSFHNVAQDGIMALAKATFFAIHPDKSRSEFPISSAIMVTEKGRNDDEWAKKVETDITTKALSKLGFNADVFLGMYDDNRYVNQLKAKAAAAPKKELTQAQYTKTFGSLGSATEEQVEKAKVWANKFPDSELKTKLLSVIEAKEKILAK